MRQPDAMPADDEQRDREIRASSRSWQCLKSSKLFHFRKIPCARDSRRRAIPPAGLRHDGSANTTHESQRVYDAIISSF